MERSSILPEGHSSIDPYGMIGLQPFRPDYEPVRYTTATSLYSNSVLIWFSTHDYSADCVLKTALGSSLQNIPAREAILSHL